MFQIINPAARTIAAATLLSAIALANPAAAQSTTPTTTQPGAGQPTAQPAPAKTVGTRARRSPVDRVEARITDLHAKLQITDAQKPQWDALVQVMRDNAKTMETLLKARAQKVSTASAVDDLNSYEALAEAHADGLKKFIPAFEALYASMSDEQKKNADAVFQAQQHRHSRTKRS